MNSQQPNIMFFNAAIALLLCLLFIPSSSFAQLSDDIQERRLKQIEQESFEKEIIEKKAEKTTEQKKYRLSSTIGLEGKYETNPRLTTSTKGDKSGHVNYSTHYKRPLSKGLIFNFNYNVDGTLYTEMTNLSNLLNHARLSLDKSFNKYITVSGGYDVSAFYYPKEKDSDYYFHKAFISVKHNITKKFYHQAMYEEGVKLYNHVRPYSDSTTSFLDNHRRDYRHAVEYSVGLAATKKATLKMRSKYTINDANALFQDYHDYKELSLTPSVNYKLTDKLALSLSMAYSDKDYAARLVAGTSNTRRDKTYTPNVGLRYNLTKSQSVSLGYNYTQNTSNDATGEYASHTVNGGWQCNF